MDYNSCFLYQNGCRCSGVGRGLIQDPFAYNKLESRCSNFHWKRFESPHPNPWLPMNFAYILSLG